MSTWRVLYDITDEVMQLANRLATLPIVNATRNEDAKLVLHSLFWIVLWEISKNTSRRKCNVKNHHHHLIIYSLTARVVGAPQIISQPVSSILLCSPLPSRTWRTQACPFSDVVFSLHMNTCPLRAHVSGIIKPSRGQHCQPYMLVKLTISVTWYRIS